MTHCINRGLFFFFAFHIALGTAAASETYFAFDSAPTSWVGRGYTDYYVSPDTGWTITASRNHDNGVTFRIDRDAGPDPGRDNYYWTLDFAAPLNAELRPGLYENSARYPFQNSDQPGLTLSGNHRGNNTNGGFFRVLDASYATNGDVERFAADFTQYGEMNTSRWVVGEIRFNAIPEPSTYVLSVFALAGFCRYRRGRKGGKKSDILLLMR